MTGKIVDTYVANPVVSLAENNFNICIYTGNSVQSIVYRASDISAHPTGHIPYAHCLAKTLLFPVMSVKIAKQIATKTSVIQLDRPFSYPWK